jgi:hypothetical protein
MTLISVHNSEGCYGRCDAKCYNARAPECDCICGGRNHGAGLKRAQNNTTELSEQWIEKWKGEHPNQHDSFLVRQNGKLAPHEQIGLPIGI